MKFDRDTRLERIEMRIEVRWTFGTSLSERQPSGDTSGRMGVVGQGQL